MGPLYRGACQRSVSGGVKTGVRPREPRGVLGSGGVAPLQLELLGGFQARSGRGHVIALPTRKAQALLAYLALPTGRGHPRDKLAALLWGGMAQKQARGNLRQVLATLRRALGETGALRLEGEAVALDPAGVAVDVAVFEAGVAAGTPAGLAEAADVYRGDLLAGLALQEPPFEDWLLAERERLRELAVEALARRLTHQRQLGEPEAAIQSALKLLTLDPLQEPVHRTLMRLYMRLGRRSAALRQYQTCVAALERELRAQPEPETRALYQQILTERSPTPGSLPSGAVEGPSIIDDGRGPPPRSRPGAVAAGDMPALDSPLVGRETELAWLTERLDAAWQGRGQLVAVLGDAGVGKTRLAAEVVAVAAQRSARILVGRGFETEQRLPFAMWVQALRSGGGLDDAAVAAVHPAWRSELAQLLPEVGAPAAPAREGADPLRLFEAVTRLVEQLAARAPLLVVCEDAHWIDEMSLRLLAFLARRLVRSPLLVLATAREEEVASSALHRQIGEELRHQGLLAGMRLRPLTKDATLALARQLLPPGAPALLTDEIWRISEGNAFMAVETGRMLAERGGGPRAGGISLSARVRDLVGGRLDRLSPSGRRLVSAAAVIGRQFDFELLHRVTGLPETEAADGMEELVRRRLLQQSGDGFEFTHDRIREVAYGRLLGPQRRLLHRQVAESLEVLRAADADGAGDLAVHCREAGAWARAVHHFARFAEQAARRYAHADAAQALQQALAALGHLPAGRERDREELSLALRRAHSLYFLGQWTESVDTLVSRAALLSSVDDPGLAAPWHAWLGHIYARIGDHDGATASARRAIEVAERTGDDASSGKAHGVLSLEAFWRGQPREGIELGTRAEALLDRGGERWWLAMVRFYTAMNAISSGRFAEARATLGRMRAVGEAIADNRLQSYATWATGWCEALEGRAADATASCRRAIDLTTDPVSAAYASAFLGYAQLEAGDGAAAAPPLAEAVDQFARFGFRAFEAWFLALLAEARRRGGHLAAAVEAAHRGEALAREAGYPFAAACARRVLGRVAAAEGARDDATRWLHEALAGFRAVDAEFEAARTRLDLADLAWARPDAALARAHAGAARDAFRALDLPGHAAAAEALHEGPGGRRPA
jgi:DNA-binding SARP family transcriptional activator